MRLFSPKRTVVSAVALVATLATPALAQTKLTDVQRQTMEKAIAGDAQAESNVGMMFYTGDGVPKSDTQAANWFQMSADGGNSDGEYNLGMMFLNGRGVVQNDASATKWLTASALKGESNAQLMLGLINSAGIDGGDPDDATSIAWTRISAQNGNETAQTFLELIGSQASPDDLEMADEKARMLQDQMKQVLAMPPAFDRDAPPLPK